MSYYLKYEGNFWERKVLRFEVWKEKVLGNDLEQQSFREE